MPLRRWLPLLLLLWWTTPAAAQLGTLASPGPLSGSHAVLEGLANCQKCHEPGRQVTASKCLACHKPIADRIARKAGVHRDVADDCVSCHVEHMGRAADLRPLDRRAFDHAAETGFPLEGGHAPLSLDCARCHKTRSFLSLNPSCSSCHTDVHRGALGSECATCHSARVSFKDASRTFDHGRTAFALTGAHTRVACAACHVVKPEAPARTDAPVAGMRFRGLPKDCASCHRDPHLGQVVQACETCHSTKGFATVTYTHRGLDGFFVGRHESLECVQCHTKVAGTYPAGRGVALKFKVGKECSSCHRDAHNGSLGTACASCHAPDNWRSPNRAFHKVTAFPLEGRHLGVPCASCHVNGQLKGTPTRCYDCHWIRRQDDRYRTRLGNECEACHRPVSWTAVNWDHGARTGLALNAAHRLLACDSCHRNQVFAGSRPECFACHEGQYRAASNPSHVAAGFPTACDLCHRPALPTFAGATFVHAAFQLVGQHGTQPCAACHRNNLYRGTPRDCIGCHLADYQRTQNPGHAAAGFPTSCDTCHRPTAAGWRGSATFNHSAVFQLAGQHASAACTSCHQNNQYRGTPRECVACHQVNYQRTQNPNHAAAGFPTACESCHRSGGPGWASGSGFNHNAAFALSGAHTSTSCANCHRSGQYKGTPRECVACHQVDYQRTQNPNHASAGFPTACEACHRSGGPGWTGASFSHNQFFPLQGVHASQPCGACHRSGQYKGTPRDCVGCHLANYQSTRSPNHVAAGFPTTCSACHRATDSSWNQGRFDHIWFPVTSGRHAGNACSACHQDPNNYKSFTCLTCHDRSKMDSEHSGRAGYRYESNACYSCHPQGRE